jgi:hypothetical protein
LAPQTAEPGQVVGDALPVAQAVTDRQRLPEQRRRPRQVALRPPQRREVMQVHGDLERVPALTRQSDRLDQERGGAIQLSQHAGVLAEAAQRQYDESVVSGLSS